MDVVNYSLYTLPAAVILAYVPHFIKGSVIKNATGKYNNQNPRSQLEKIEQKMSKEAFTKAQRCSAAHSNALEGFPVFASAVILGNMARLPISTLNAYAVGYISIRAIYTALYVSQKSEKTAAARSITWVAGIASCITLMIKAANVLAKL
ncbi:hypothetical protein DFS34DRAFT_611538 [Phlyctochytrium arcticum]|nr:hypothetical protein DFS34DRAFT_611538 [Phlyctochytrium arcticum]